MKSRRRWRWPDGSYHVINRGARRLSIFADVSDRAYFVRLLALTSRNQNVQVTAWRLMDNHYHLVLQGSGETIGRMIRDLEKSCARSFNLKTGHSDALFQGRFGSTWLPDMRAVAYDLARIMGFASGHCVGSLVSRMHERLEARPELRGRVEEVLLN